ncbi:MAG TPA: YfhO family protein [Bryobacteraceae bacterium]|nr:YfhO family protein [Bryobacteraceae bacterium]
MPVSLKPLTSTDCLRSPVTPAHIVAGAGQRLPFLRKLIAGAFSGVLLASPLIVPFFEYQHLSAFAHVIGSGHLPAAAFAMNLFPYLFGPIGAFSSFDSSHQLENIWGAVGGYLGVSTLFLSVLALTARKSNSGLRWLLALWVLVFFARSFGAPGFVFLFRLIPGMDLIQIHRYADPSWQMAAIILAAFALEDWREIGARNLRRTLLGLSITVVVCALALWCGSGPLLVLLKSPGPALWLRSSLAWPCLIVPLAAWLLSRRSTPQRRVLLALLLLLDAVALFVVPTLAGLRKPVIDFAPEKFLAEQVGLYRVYSLGPLAPNYSAYFGFASINHNAVPTPGDWTRYIDRSLDPDVDPSIFVGGLPQPSENRSVDPFQKLVSPPNRPRPQLVYQDWYARIFELPNPAPYFQASGSECRLSFHSRQSVQAYCSAPAYLIRRELLYPGWQASVNGKPVILTRTASIFQSVPLPAGESLVVFRYFPSYFYWTVSGALVAWLFIIGSWTLALPDCRKRRANITITVPSSQNPTASLLPEAPRAL